MSKIFDNSYEKRPCKKCGFKFTRNQLGTGLTCAKCRLDSKMPMLMKLALENCEQKEKKEQADRDLKLKISFAVEIYEKGIITKTQLMELKKYFENLGYVFKK